MELIIKKPTKFVQDIEWNNDELKAAVADKLAKYDGLTYTAETIPEAKKDRAFLNSSKKFVDDKRKAVKKEINAPYMVFEKEVKEITGMIDDVSSKIAEQVKSFESHVKNLKREEIEQEWQTAAGDLIEMFPIEKVFNMEWLNQKPTIDKIVIELNGIADKMRKDLAIIDRIEPDFQIPVKDKYIQTLDISDALAEEMRLIVQKERIDAQKKAQDADAAKLRQTQEEIKTSTVIHIAETKPEPEREWLKIKVFVTEEQKELFRDIIRENKIKCKLG